MYAGRVYMYCVGYWQRHSQTYHTAFVVHGKVNVETTQIYIADWLVVFHTVAMWRLGVPVDGCHLCV